MVDFYAMWIRQKSIQESGGSRTSFAVRQCCERTLRGRRAAAEQCFFWGTCLYSLGTNLLQRSFHCSAEPPAIFFPAKYEKAPISVPACSERCVFTARAGVCTGDSASGTHKTLAHGAGATPCLGLASRGPNSARRPPVCPQRVFGDEGLARPSRVIDGHGDGR
jgi:hypothetical protein